MELLAATRSSFKVMQLLQPGILHPMLQSHQVRYRQTKHWNPKFKRLRGLKFIKVELPNFQEKSSDLSKEEIRSRMKERGVFPPRPWVERPFYISCTGAIFEAYVPPEGDGKKSFISSVGAKQKFEFLEKKSKSMLAIRKMRSYEEDFDSDTFATEAQDIYIAAHNYMASKEKYKLREVITERCYPEMMHNIRYKTINWSFLKSLEPPRVVHARVTDVVTKQNLFAQVTVRFHTQQKLAIYDRFGRLMHGSELIPKDVLEYVVFEKHISNEYGQWRLHDKIIPDWLPPKDPAEITYHFIEEETEVKQLAEGDKKLEAGEEKVKEETASAGAVTAAIDSVEEPTKTIRATSATTTTSSTLNKTAI